MAPLETDFTLPTPYGAATFTLSLTEAGDVTVTRLPLGSLPPSVFQLTYGQRWRTVLDHFTALAATLPYQLGAVLFAARFPEEFTDVVVRFREKWPATVPNDYGRFWSRHAKQLKLFSLAEDKLIGALDAFRQRAAGRGVSEFGPHLQPYLVSLLPLASHRVNTLLYAVLGLLGTDEANEYLLSELESAGRHPFTSRILRALYTSNDRATFERLTRVYRNDKFGADELPEYIHLLTHFPSSTGVTDHLAEILSDHPVEVTAVVRAQKALGLDNEEIAGVVRRQFDREEGYRPLADLLTVTNEQQSAAHHIDLATLNEKLDAPRYIDLPPVSWPQLLEAGWKELVGATSAPEVLALVDRYLARPEPRLQRNAILQLKYFLGTQGEPTSVAQSTENRLRDLLSSPFDKVYVEILNILGDQTLMLNDKQVFFDSLLEVSIRSRYRTVVLRALHKVGKAPEWRAYARAHYLRALDGATELKREQITTALPYLERYLEDVTDIRAALQQSTPR